MSNILKDLNLEQLKSVCNVSINSILKEIEHRENNIEKSKEDYFSVSTEKKVIFSQGNLQYHCVRDEWRFAPKQTDYIGNNNTNISPNYNGWIDLFGWGSGHYPINKSTNSEDYRINTDWGINKIGDCAPNTWRTLTSDEWNYIICGRDKASRLIGVAQVNGVNGIIILPDNWICPNNITFKTGFHNGLSVENYGHYQKLSVTDWNELEKFGAIFLPAGGHRYGSRVKCLQNYGYYWSSNEYISKYPSESESVSPLADFLYFAPDMARVFSHNRFVGRSVRLVKDVL